VTDKALPVPTAPLTINRRRLFVFFSTPSRILPGLLSDRSGVYPRLTPWITPGSHSRKAHAHPSRSMAQFFSSPISTCFDASSRFFFAPNFGPFTPFSGSSKAFFYQAHPLDRITAGPMTFLARRGAAFSKAFPGAFVDSSSGTVFRGVGGRYCGGICAGLGT
jgi:hypothetical protein